MQRIIRNELQRQGMTQARLAELAAMTEARVSDYLAGKHDVRAETLQRMLEALNLKIAPARLRQRKGR